MKFTITVPKSLNYTPADLMKRYAEENDRKFIFTCNRYFTACLYERATDTVYYYDHWQIGTPTPSHITITVFLKEKEA